MRFTFWNGAALMAAVVLLAVGGPWLAREILGLPRSAVLAARADQRVVTLEIGGMTCEGCARSVRSQIEAMEGVSAVEVRFAQRRAYVVCTPVVSDSALVDAVERPGPAYTASVVGR